MRAFFESEQSWIQGLLANASTPEFWGQNDAKFHAIC